MTKLNFTIATVLLSLLTTTGNADDWNQWRGALRNGVDAQSPALLNALPVTGIKPRWFVTKDITSGNDGGWSSPVVADGRVYLFTHRRTKVNKEKLPPRKYPWFARETRPEVTKQQYKEYEVKRRNEDEQRSKSYRYDEFIFCFDADTGKLLWKNERVSSYSRFPQSGSPAVVGGRLYVLGSGLNARCVDVVSGKNVWMKRLPGEFRDEIHQSSFVVASGVAVVLAKRLFALDANSGELLWQGKNRDATGLHTSPVVWNDAGTPRVIVNVSRSETLCVDLKTGQEQWRVKAQGGHATPVVVGDRLLTYGGSRKKGLRCFQLSPKGAKLLWKYQGAADSGSSPVALNGFVYVQGGRRLACIDLKNGKAAWMTMLSLKNAKYTSPVAADGKVFYAVDGFHCFKADAEAFQVLYHGKIDQAGLLADEETFRKQLEMERLEATAEGQKQANRLWRQKIDNHGPLQCASPAIVDGRVYVRLKTGLACYDLLAK